MNKISWDYVAAFIDADGYVSNVSKDKKSLIVISNTQKEILDLINNFLVKQGLSPKIYKRQKKNPKHLPIYHLYIGTYNDIYRMYLNCHILHPKKQKRLKDIMEYHRYKKPKYQRMINFVKLKKEHPDYTFKKCGEILNEHPSQLYRWSLII